jgi:hypothetical protein
MDADEISTHNDLEMLLSYMISDPDVTDSRNLLDVIGVLREIPIIDDCPIE